MNHNHTATTEPTAQERSAAPTADRLPHQHRQPEWFFYSAGDVLGPFTVPEMRSFVAEGRLSPDVDVTRRGVPDWRPASADDLLAPLLQTVDGNHQPTPPPAAPSTRPDAPRVTIWPSGPAVPSNGTTSSEGVAIGRNMGALKPFVGEDVPDAMAQAASRGHAQDRHMPALPGAIRHEKLVTVPDRERNTAIGRQKLISEQDKNVHYARWVSLMSLILPGAGQLANGQQPRAVLFFLGTIFAWSIGLGWLLHIWAALDAWKGGMRITVGDRQGEQQKR